MLNVNPEAVYNSLSINEPGFVKKYAPLPLQAPYTDKNVMRKYISEPSAPTISLSQNPHSSNINTLNKKSSSQKSKSDPHKCSGPHTTCSYVVGHGMVWEDLSRCHEHDALV